MKFNPFKGASKLVDSLGNAGDKLFTSKDEKNKAANQRLSIDSLNDNWLSKSIRPLILLMFTVFFFAAIIFNIELKENEVQIIKIVFQYAIPFYFGGRLIEKIIKK